MKFSSLQHAASTCCRMRPQCGAANSTSPVTQAKEQQENRNVINKVAAKQSIRCIIAAAVLCVAYVLLQVAGVVVVVVVASHARTLHQQPLAKFSSPSLQNITHLAYDATSDALYVAGTNTLLQLSADDLSKRRELTTGPVLDHPQCGSSLDCQEFDELRRPTQNVNKLLVVDAERRKLIACGSVKQGACRRYSLDNIAETPLEDLVPLPVAANDDSASTVAVVAPARYATSSQLSLATGEQQQQQQQAANHSALYVAASFTKGGQSRDLLVPAIGSRSLDAGANLLKLHENSMFDSSRVDIATNLRDYFVVSYQFGFASSAYVYFVTQQRRSASRDNEELGYHTRLARVCNSDSSFNSYVEVDLVCGPQQQQQWSGTRDTPSYPLLQAATLIDAADPLLASFASSGAYPPLADDADNSKLLVAAFSSARDHTAHAGSSSALCAYPLAAIEAKFADNIVNCFTGKTKSRNMDYVAGSVQDCPGAGGDVTNFCQETLKINGSAPIVAEPLVEFADTKITALAALTRDRSTLAFAATSTGSLKKVSVRDGIRELATSVARE